jgi:hypothetical protein
VNTFGKIKKQNMKEVIEDLIYQFAYHEVIDGKPALYAGGVSALERAFDALEWDNPHFIQEEGNTCEIEGCMEEPSSGQTWGDCYLSLCLKHGRMKREDQPRPKVKRYAIDREATRDPITGWLPLK